MSGTESEVEKLMKEGADEVVEYSRFKSDYQQQFEELNVKWLKAHGLFEPADLICLRHTQEKVIDLGGEVFFAISRQKGEVVGSCAAIPVPGKPVIELGKLTVAERFQRRGIARKLCDLVLTFAREQGNIHQVVLSSNSALVGAIHLYESLGFDHCAAPLDELTPYQTADVYMMMRLTT